MIAARILQALGGGLIIPVSMAIVYYLAPREKMGAAMGFWGLAAILVLPWDRLWVVIL